MCAGAKRPEGEKRREKRARMTSRGVGASADEQVDIIVGTQNLTDSFEWDLNSLVTPEEFALSHTKELGLSGEFA